MASNSPGVNKAGRATPEYKATQGMFDRLVDHCQPCLHFLSNKLLSSNFLTKPEHGELISKQQNYQASSTFIDRILWKIEYDSSHFEKFVSALKESDLNDAADALEAACKRVLDQSISIQSSISHSSTTFSGIVQKSSTLGSNDALGSVCSSSISQQAASDYFVAPVGPEQVDHAAPFDDEIQPRDNSGMYQAVSDSHLAHGQSSFMKVFRQQSCQDSVYPFLKSMPRDITSQAVIGSSISSLRAYSSRRQIRTTQDSYGSATTMGGQLTAGTEGGRLTMGGHPAAGAEGRRTSMGGHPAAGVEGGSAPIPGSFNSRSNFHDTSCGLNCSRNRIRNRSPNVDIPLDRSRERAATVYLEPSSAPVPDNVFVGSFNSRSPSVHSVASYPCHQSTPRYHTEHYSAPTGVPPQDSHIHNYSGLPSERKSSEACSESEIEFLRLSEANRDSENRMLRHLLSERKNDVDHLYQMLRVQEDKILELKRENIAMAGLQQDMEGRLRSYEGYIETLSTKLVRAKEDSVHMYSKLLRDHMLLLNEKKKSLSQLRRFRSYSVDLDHCARSPPSSAILNVENNSHVPVQDTLDDLVQRLQGLDLHMNSKSVQYMKYCHYTREK